MNRFSESRAQGQKEFEQRILRRHPFAFFSVIGIGVAIVNLVQAYQGGWFYSEKRR